MITRRATHGLLGMVLAAAALQFTLGSPAFCAQQTVRERAPLKVANRHIIDLHGPVAGITAKERVTSSTERIEQALAADRMPAVTMEEIPEGVRVLLGGKNAFLVAHIDANSEAGETPRLVAMVAMKRLEQAIVERREQETPLYLAKAAGISAVATLFYALLFWLLRLAHRWASARVAAAAAAHSASGAAARCARRKARASALPRRTPCGARPAPPSARCGRSTPTAR